nr:hypothetical protein [Tanacetum cinerariifolium]
MAQQVSPSAQLVPKYHTIGRCNNKAVLQSISCSPEYKIVGQILLDHPLMETLDNLFIAPLNIETIEAFMNKVGYQRVIDKVRAFYMKNFAQPWQKMFKDDIPLVSLYTTRDVCVRGMLILDEFLTKEIRATDDFMESTPSAYRTPTLTTSPQGKKRKQSAEEEIEKMVEDDEDEESYASEFADLFLNDDVDDFGTRIEPESYKENLKKVDDDDKYLR